MTDTHVEVDNPATEPPEKTDWWSRGGQSEASRLANTAARPQIVAVRPPGDARRSTGLSGNSRSRINAQNLVGAFALLIGAGAMLAGSLTSWLSYRGGVFSSHHITGMSYSSMGWISLIAGMVAGAAGLAFAVSARATTRRFLSLAAGAAAGASLAAGIYTAYHEPTGHGLTMGWGLIMVLAGAVLTLLVAFSLNLAED